MRIVHFKKLYLPALSIVAVVFFLLVLISISTYRNLDREKETALKFVYRQGLALLRSMEAGARAGMMSPMWQEDSVAGLILETGKNEDIAYIYLSDEKGVIVHHSEPIKKGDPAGWNPLITNEGQVVTRIRILPDGTQVYELAKFFSPLYETFIMNRPQGTAGRGQYRGSQLHRGETIVLGMKMTGFEEARRSDIQHALIMAAILVILGSGVLFFIFVIQNYYLVDRTLKQTQDYTRQVVASMANGLLSVDIEGKIVSYNLLALELLGLEESEAKGADFKAILDFQTTGIFQTLNHCQSVLEKEIQYRKRSGKIVPLALSATPILEESGNCQGAVVILRNLEEIKILEEKVRRSEKLAAIGKLAAGVAHEIRNPLSSIRGFAQYLRHALEDKPREQEYAETMVSEVDRIDRVVTDLLTFARPMEAELVPTDVTELIEHSVRLVQNDAQSRNVEIRTNISDLSKVPMDVNQMTQALLNLLLNSLQAVESGGSIEIGAELNLVDSGLILWVKDNGSGIAPDQREKIFDPFFTTREKGTGLGLAIVHKIVENHNGEISVESSPAGKSRGCRFTISIPTNVKE